MVRRLRALVRKEFLQLLRDPVLVSIALYIFLEASTCAAALQLDVKHVPLVAYDGDRTTQSRELLGRFDASPNFSIVDMLAAERESVAALDSGHARIAIIIPHGYAASLARSESGQVQIISDGSDAYGTLLADGYAQQIIAQDSQQRLMQRAGLLGNHAQQLPLIDQRISVWYDPPLLYPHFNIVMMLALAVPIVAILLAAASFAKETESGTIEHIAVTPVRPWEFVVAKLVPTGTLALVGVTIGILLAHLFGAPLRGNIVFFYAVTIVAFIASSGIGILIATVSRNVQQALLLGFFILFPLLFLSGTITPVQNMPPLLQALTYISPVRYFGQITVNIFFKGGGPLDLWPQILALCALSIAIFSAAFVRLRRGLT
ncbi:MAG: ABC transporter permease [Candidatus Tyrphobacter sp.]